MTKKDEIRRKNLISQHYCPDCGLPMNHYQSNDGKKILKEGYYCGTCGFSPEGLRTVVGSKLE